jgi:hypothetical protein
VIEAAELAGVASCEEGAIQENSLLGREIGFVAAMKDAGSGGGPQRTAASQRLVSLKFALELPAVGDPALIVIGLPNLVFITQGPSGQVKHP